MKKKSTAGNEGSVLVALLRLKAIVADKAASCTVYRHTQTFCGLAQTLKASGFMLF